MGRPAGLDGIYGFLEPLRLRPVMRVAYERSQERYGLVALAVAEVGEGGKDRIIGDARRQDMSTLGGVQGVLIRETRLVLEAAGKIIEVGGFNLLMS